MLPLFRLGSKLFFIIVLMSLFSVPAWAQTRTHTVVRGENLFRIGLRYGCTISQMARANHIADPSRIFVGQVLVIPDCSGTTTTPPINAAPVVTNPIPNSAATPTLTLIPTTPNPTPNTNTFVGSPADNWCYEGGQWGDGRCNVGDEGQRNYMWRLGWLNARLERGEIPRETLPADLGGQTTTNNTTGNTNTTNNNSGGSSGGSGTTGTVGCVNGSVIDLVNCARGQSGLAPLFSNALLEAAALGHAQDMVNNNFFSHTGSNGSSVGSRVTAVGYPWMAVGENIAQGQTTEYQVFTDWMNSPGHRANILSPDFIEIGVARVGNTWVQVFGRQ